MTTRTRFIVMALGVGVGLTACDRVDWEDLFHDQGHGGQGHGGQECPPKAAWDEIGAGHPIVGRDGQPGVVIRPTFADARQPKLMSAVICPADAVDTKNWLNCRPATSCDGAASFSLDDSPAFDTIETNGWGNWSAPVVVRSPVDTRRMYYAASGHPWYTPAPKGGIWRSDDGGATWTANLVDGQPGESGEIVAVVPDPAGAGRVFINRGYDFGNISVSDDAGATFSIICGDNNVEKTTDDIWCTQGATMALDFSRQRLYFKHFFQSVSVSLQFDGTDPQTFSMPGLTDSSGTGAFIAVGDLQFDAPIAGLSPRPIGGRSFRFTADGQSALYANGNGQDPSQRVWQSAAGFSTGHELANVVPDGTKLIFAHPRHACTWVIQTGPTALMKTANCGASWTPVPMTGFTSTSPIIAGAYAPDQTDALIVFTKNGQRFRASLP